jgi:hypothetical protein
MRWEYKTLQLDTYGWVSNKLTTKQLDQVLGDLGRDDWELVTSFREDKYYILVFKRPLN